MKQEWWLQQQSCITSYNNKRVLLKLALAGIEQQYNFIYMRIIIRKFGNKSILLFVSYTRGIRLLWTMLANPYLDQAQAGSKNKLVCSVKKNITWIRNIEIFSWPVVIFYNKVDIPFLLGYFSDPKAAPTAVTTTDCCFRD